MPLTLVLWSQGRQMSEIKAIHTCYGLHSELEARQSYLVRLSLKQRSKQHPHQSLECQFLYCFLNSVFCKQEKNLEKCFQKKNETHSRFSDSGKDFSPHPHLCCVSHSQTHIFSAMLATATPTSLLYQPWPHPHLLCCVSHGSPSSCVCCCWLHRWASFLSSQVVKTPLCPAHLQSTTQFLGMCVTVTDSVYYPFGTCLGLCLHSYVKIYCLLYFLIFSIAMEFSCTCRLLSGFLWYFLVVVWRQSITLQPRLATNPWHSTCHVCRILGLQTCTAMPRLPLLTAYIIRTVTWGFTSLSRYHQNIFFVCTNQHLFCHLLPGFVWIHPVFVQNFSTSW